MNYKYLDPRVDTIDTIRAIRQKCLDLMMEGKTIISYASEGNSVTKAALIPISDLLEETKYFIRDYTGNYPVTSVKTFFR